MAREWTGHDVLLIFNWMSYRCGRAVDPGRRSSFRVTGGGGTNLVAVFRCQEGRRPRTAGVAIPAVEPSFDFGTAASNPRLGCALPMDRRAGCRTLQSLPTSRGWFRLPPRLIASYLRWPPAGTASTRGFHTIARPRPAGRASWDGGTIPARPAVGSSFLIGRLIRRPQATAADDIGSFP